MKKAHGLLASSSSAHRTVILLSEAILTSTPEAQWVDAWVSLLREAQSAGIRYYAIGLGSGSPSGLLYSMAENTGGNYYHPASFHHLEAVVSDVFAHAAYHLVASQVILREQVDLSNFEIVPDSFEFSEGMLMPSVGELASLMRTGEIIVPLGQLPSNKQRVFGFRLRVKQCLPPEHPQGSATIGPSRPTSMISYRYGPTTYQEKLPAGAIRCFKLSGLFFRKDYDEQKDEVVITLQSTYRPSAMIDNTIRSIRIYDYPSFHYQYVVGSAHPSLEKFIPGAKADLLHWFFPRLSPQERMELRFKVNLAAYRPRDANPLRLGAERRPEGSESWAEFILPDKNAQKILLPQKYRYVADLPVIPEGRPDLHITPPLDEDKFYNRVPEEIDLSHITIPPEGLAALWPFPQNPFAGQETPDVWIDSEKNGFVTRWEPATDPEVVNQMKMRMQNVILNPSSGVFQGIEGQGDLFHRKQKNRIFIRVHNGGESPSPRMENGLKLSIFNYGTKDWEVLRALDLPEMPPDPSASRILFVELPSDTLKDAWLQPFGGPGKGAWTALLKVFLTPSPNEAHINNNTATEKIFVVD